MIITAKMQWLPSVNTVDSKRDNNQYGQKGVKHLKTRQLICFYPVFEHLGLVCLLKDEKEKYKLKNYREVTINERNMETVKKRSGRGKLLYACSWYFNNFVAGYFRIDSLYYFGHFLYC